MVTVGEEIDFVAYPHRENVLSFVVGDVGELCGADLVDPDVVGLASAVVFPSAEFTEGAVHCKILAVR
jgi:hypothetical protein